jgi:amidase
MLDSATSLARRLRDREITSEELVADCLSRAEAINPRINAIVALADDAIAAAKRADQRLASGSIDGPLHGVPMTIKDCFDTAGVVSTWGTLGRRHFVPHDDATVVKRLKAAGAILLGKTNTPELTLNFSTYNKIHGFTKNPFDLERSPGGSSGGAAAAIACGLTSFDIGTDFGGSIRVPSHFCGIAGIKPTSGSVPRTGLCLPPGWLMDFMSHVGPMARTVADLGLILPIIWGPDSIDTSIVPVPFPDIDRVALGELRCAVMVDNGLSKPDEETVAVVMQSAELLKDAGLDVQWNGLDGVPELGDLVRGLFRLGGYAFISQYTRALGTEPKDVANNWLRELDPDEVSAEEFSQWRREYFEITADDLNRHMTSVEDFRRRLLQQMADVDVLISPVNPTPAPMLPPEGESPFPDGSYTEVFDVTGWPAGVVRAGTSSTGLPIGVQVVANPWREDIVLAVMALIEAGLPKFPPPGLALE